MSPRTRRPMNVQVLGSIAVGTSRHSMEPIRSSRLRELLALLAARRPGATSIDSIIEAFWGDEPPASATTAVHVAVSRLRTLLEPDRRPRQPSEVVVRTSAGYRLDLGDDELDVARFETLAQVALSADSSWAAYNEATAAWADPPFCEFADHPWAVAESERLRLLRQSLTHSQAERALATGRHGEIVDRLRMAIRDQPYDERIAGWLMTALFRLGRQHDALVVYRGIRLRLIDDLGLHPGAALDSVHRSVLEHDPHLLGRGPSGGAAAPADRTSLPPASSSFFGRSEELDQLGDLVRRASVVTLVGPAGSGKTRFVCEFCDALDRNIAFVDLSTVATDTLVIEAIAEQLGFVVEPGHDLLRSIGAAFDSASTLVVLDNCELVIAGAATAAASLARSERVTVIATSREPLALSSERIMTIDPLAVPSSDSTLKEIRATPACRLLADRSGLTIESNNATTMAAICARVDGLPLAVELAAYMLRSSDPVVVLEHLDAGRPLAAPRDAPNRHRSLDSMLESSLAPLDENARNILSALAAFAGAVPAEAVAELAMLPVPTARETLRELDTRSLVTTHVSRHDQAPTYSLLHVVRANVRRRHDPQHSQEYRRRHAETILRIARGKVPTGTAVLGPADVPSEIGAALEWLESTGNQPDTHFGLVAAVGSY